jgi:hypothetical protein
VWIGKDCPVNCVRTEKYNPCKEGCFWRRFHGLKPDQFVAERQSDFAFKQGDSP